MDLYDTCLQTWTARPKRKFLNSIKTVPGWSCIPQADNFPAPLPIRDPLPLRVSGKCGNATNHI